MQGTSSLVQLYLHRRIPETLQCHHRFDDIKKTCSVINASELTTADSVEIETLDEYTTDYDEDGSFSTSSTANLEYNLGDSANRDNYEVIPKKVFDSFEIVHSEELMASDRQFASTTLLWSEKRNGRPLSRITVTTTYMWKMKTGIKTGSLLASGHH